MRMIRGKSPGETYRDGSRDTRCGYQTGASYTTRGIRHTP
jgi:hypothetical protein